MAETKLGKSKKFANGTIHENASGQFLILDRFLKNNVITLRFEWLTGEKAGTIEENKETNMNASIYKYQVSRGLIDGEEPVKTLTPTDVYEVAEKCLDILRIYQQDRQLILKSNEQMALILEKQEKLIEQISRDLKHNTERMEKSAGLIANITATVEKNTLMITEIKGERDIVSKLVDKLPN